MPEYQLKLSANNTPAADPRLFPEWTILSDKIPASFCWLNNPVMQLTWDSVSMNTVRYSPSVDLPLNYLLGALFT